MLLVLGLLVAVVVLLPIAFLAKAFAPVDERDVAALHKLSGVAPTASTRRLFAAYLSRSRRYRTGWSVAAWMSALVLGLGLGSHSVNIGHRGEPFYEDLLLMGLAGYLLGAIVAELHHLRRGSSGVRMASLAPRRLEDYVSRRQQWFMRVLGVLALVLVGTGVIVARSEAAPLLGYGLAALAVWALVEAAERAVVERARPVLPEDLADADDAIRAATMTTLSLGGAGLVALLTTGVAFAVSAGVDADGVGVVMALAGTGLFFTAIASALRARRAAWPQRKLEVDGAPH